MWPESLGSVLELSEDEVVVGRGSARRIAHNTVSRAHAALRWDRALGAHTVEDLGSHNGTSVNGQRIRSRIALRTGAVLRFGDVLAVYESLAAEPTDGDDEVFGRAAALDGLRLSIDRAASDLAPTLITGESGTGKERVARALHSALRRPGRLVAINCAAIAPQLVEAQLFGHVKGAFTGATEAREGLFRAADGGSVLLDEIGDLPLDLQPKLLRVVEEAEVLPVGATRPVAVSVKVIAATHRDLRAAVAAGLFRADLYGRLALRELSVPPLRERAVDVLQWLARFSGGAKLELHPDAAERLLTARWPLNLRTLDRLARALAERVGSAVTRDELPRWIDDETSGTHNQEASQIADTTKRSPTRDEFVAAYRELGGSVHGLARRFGRDRRQIYRWVEAFELDRER